MNRAYLFPFGIDVDRDHTHVAMPVTTEYDYDTVVQASRNHRLRCSYAYCLERVKPVRQSVDADVLRCFAHLAATSESPPCPYRTETWGESGTSGSASAREHNLRKMIESALQVELQRALVAQGRTVRIEGSAFKDPEPLIRISGLDAPLEIRCLAPGCEQLWTRPFDGTVDGAEVLFFVITPDEPRLKKSFFDEHLLARRPAIVVAPGEKDEEHTWTATSTLGNRPKATRAFAAVDLMRVDYRLFGLDRSAETLFIPTSHRQAILRIAERLKSGSLIAPQIALLRGLAARVLAEGAAVPPLELEKISGRDLGLLLGARELQRFVSEDPLVAPLWEPFFADAFVDLDRERIEVRARLAKAEAERASAVAAAGALRDELTSTRADRTSLGGQLEEARKALSDEQQKRKDLQREHDEVHRHWLGRIALRFID